MLARSDGDAESKKSDKTTTTEAKTKDGKDYSMYAAIIVKTVDAKTRSTTSLNDLLRD